MIDMYYYCVTLNPEDKHSNNREVLSLEIERQRAVELRVGRAVVGMWTVTADRILWRWSA